MIDRLKVITLIMAVGISLLAAGQEGRPPADRRGGQPPPPREGQPPPPPGGPQGPPPQDANFFKSQAMQGIDQKVSLLIDMGKTDAAIEELTKVYSYEVPKWGHSHEMKMRLIGRLAEVYAKSGKKNEALQTLKNLFGEVMAGSPAEAAAWLDAGTVYKLLKMPDEALKAFDRSIELSKKLAQSGWRPPDAPQGGPAGRQGGRRP